MLKWLFPILVAYSGVACMGCACTMVGCSDHATIVVHYADGTTPPFAVDLDIDGRKVTCPPPPNDGREVCDDQSVRVTHYDDNDNMEFYIKIAGAPNRIHVILKQDDVVVGQRSFEPHYITVEPNGEWCGPECQEWSGTWELP